MSNYTGALILVRDGAGAVASSQGLAQGSDGEPVPVGGPNAVGTVQGYDTRDEDRRPT